MENVTGSATTFSIQNFQFFLVQFVKIPVPIAGQVIGHSEQREKYETKLDFLEKLQD